MVIIAGLHGSGTRYLSECFSKVMPMWITEAGGGHFEDKEILEMNERELAVRGVSWFKGKSKKRGNLVNELKRYRERRNEGGIKDPRIVYLYPEYREVFPDAKFIVCVRNPVRVAASHLRNGRLKTFEECIEWYARDLRLSLKMDTHYFNYDGDLQRQQEKLNAFVGFKVDILTNWK
jgi:hypothetical protein